MARPIHPAISDTLAVVARLGVLLQQGPVDIDAEARRVGQLGRAALDGDAAGDEFVRPPVEEGDVALAIHGIVGADGGRDMAAVLGTSSRSIGLMWTTTTSFERQL